MRLSSAIAGSFLFLVIAPGTIAAYVPGYYSRTCQRCRMTQTEAAKVLGITQARVSDLKRGKIDRFSMDLLVRLAARAGLKPTLKLAA